MNATKVGVTMALREGRGPGEWFAKSLSRVMLRGRSGGRGMRWRRTCDDDRLRVGGRAREYVGNRLKSWAGWRGFEVPAAWAPRRHGVDAAMLGSGLCDEECEATQACEFPSFQEASRLL